MASSEEKCEKLARESLQTKTSFSVERNEKDTQLSMLKGKCDYWQKRFAAYQKEGETLDAKLETTLNFVTKLTAQVAEQKKELEGLESQLTSANAELICLHPQLAAAKAIRDRAFGYGYGAGVAHQRAHLLANPRTNLKRLNLNEFKPDVALCQFVDTLGCNVMPDAFLCLPSSSETSSTPPPPK